MEDKKPLLSICIPTYNRAVKLNDCLQAIYDAIDERIEEKIEIIISDNASNDNTKEIAENFLNKSKNYSYYRNDHNLGVNKNILLLLNNYSRTKYIWIIGDDDFIDKNSLFCIVNLLESDKELDLIALKYRIFNNNDEYNSFHNDKLNNVSLSKFKVKTLSQAIDDICDYGNILGTFMSSMIYNKEKIDQDYLLKINLEPDYLSEKIQDQFPNAYFVLSSFIGTQKCYCSVEPLLSIVAFKKGWDDKLPFLYSKILPDLYFYLISIGLDKHCLKKTRKCLFFSNLMLIRNKSVKKNIIIKNTIDFFSFFYLLEILSKIFRKIFCLKKLQVKY